ncbi:DSCAM tail-less isoform [Penaeus vannamei]|uniref:DSCAM tail-less isoform n=1 Tax=Penaeus vannamei TaxID=6689 RepID=A0A423TQE7_PENVA|nr:DSCAM tail-less isoform [Penaeus vannamei]
MTSYYIPIVAVTTIILAASLLDLTLLGLEEGVDPGKGFEVARPWTLLVVVCKIGLQEVFCVSVEKLLEMKPEEMQSPKGVGKGPLGRPGSSPRRRRQAGGLKTLEGPSFGIEEEDNWQDFLFQKTIPLSSLIFGNTVTTQTVKTIKKENEEVKKRGTLWPPRGLSCAAVNASTIEVSWSAPNPADVRGIVLGYRVLYGPSQDFHEESCTFLLVSPSTAVYLEGLTNDTHYEIQVMAYTNAAVGSASPPVVCHTPPLVRSQRLPQHISDEFRINSTAELQPIGTWYAVGRTPRVLMVADEGQVDTSLLLPGTYRHFIRSPGEEGHQVNTPAGRLMATVIPRRQSDPHIHGKEERSVIKAV